MTSHNVVHVSLVVVVCVDEGLDADYVKYPQHLFVYDHVETHCACTFAMHYECIARDFCISHNLLSLEIPVQIVDDLLSGERAGACALV